MECNCALIKVNLLAACIALKVVGAVFHPHHAQKFGMFSKYERIFIASKNDKMKALPSFFLFLSNKLKMSEGCVKDEKFRAFFCQSF